VCNRIIVLQCLRTVQLVHCLSTDAEACLQYWRDINECKYEVVFEMLYVCVAITLSKWDLLEQKRKQEEEAARKQSGYDDIDGR